MPILANPIGANGVSANTASASPVGIAASCRQVPTFNGVSQRVNISWQQTSTTSYIEIGVIRTQATGEIEYISDNTVANNYLRFNSDGTIRCRVTETDDSIRNITTDILNVDQPYKLRVEFNPSNFEVFLDGVSQGSANFAIAQNLSGTWQALASRISGSYGVMAIFDADFNNEAFYPLDDGFANNPTARNTLGTDGSFENMTSAAWLTRCDI